MVASYGALRSISYGSISHITAGGSMSVPVKPAQYIYSQFNYARGVPAADGQNSVSVVKIKILDTLINQLVKMKSNTNAKDAASLVKNDAQADAFISQYEEEIQRISAAAASIPYAAQKTMLPQAGLVLDISA